MECSVPEDTAHAAKQQDFEPNNHKKLISMTDE